METIAPKKELANTEPIKRMIRDGHQRGVCDSEGNSISRINPVTGRKEFKAKSRFGSGSIVKTYVHRNGKIVEKK